MVQMNCWFQIGENRGWVVILIWTHLRHGSRPTEEVFQAVREVACDVQARLPDTTTQRAPLESQQSDTPKPIQDPP